MSSSSHLPSPVSSPCAALSVPDKAGVRLAVPGIRLQLAHRHTGLRPPAGAGHHHVELLVVDAAVPVHVGLLHHGVALLLRHRLAQVHHHVAQLRPADEPIAVLNNEHAFHA